MKKLAAGADFEAWLDTKEHSQITSWLNIIQTTFLLILLGGGALSFSKDAHDFVVIPIERMMKFVQQLSENPLGKLKPVAREKGTTEYETALIEVLLCERGCRKLADLNRIPAVST